MCESSKQVTFLTNLPKKYKLHNFIVNANNFLTVWIKCISQFSKKCVSERKHLQI